MGAPADRWVVEKFRVTVGDKLVDFVGKTRIRQISVLLRKVHLLIANDSAPMHIASAVGTRVLGLFGPTSPARGRPLGHHDVVLRAEIPCSPCGKSACVNPNRLECLTSISVEQVLELARKMVLTGHAAL
jgi:ADP-heptose:LPS heptosyltransferase